MSYPNPHPARAEKRTHGSSLSLDLPRSWELTGAEVVLRHYWALTELTGNPPDFFGEIEATLQQVAACAPEGIRGFAQLHLDAVHNQNRPGFEGAAWRHLDGADSDTQRLHELLGLVSRWAPRHAEIQPLLTGAVSVGDFLKRHNLSWAEPNVQRVEISPLAVVLMMTEIFPPGSERSVLGYAPAGTPVVMVADNYDDRECTKRHELVHRLVEGSGFSPPDKPGQILQRALEHAGLSSRSAKIAENDSLPIGRFIPLGVLKGELLLDLCREECVCQTLAMMGSLLPEDLDDLRIPRRVEADGSNFVELLMAFQSCPKALATFGAQLQFLFVELLFAQESGLIKTGGDRWRVLSELWDGFYGALRGVHEAWQTVKRSPRQLKPRFEAAAFLLKPSDYHLLPQIVDGRLRLE